MPLYGLHQYHSVQSLPISMAPLFTIFAILFHLRPSTAWFSALSHSMICFTLCVSVSLICTTVYDLYLCLWSEPLFVVCTTVRGPCHSIVCATLCGLCHSLEPTPPLVVCTVPYRLFLANATLLSGQCHSPFWSMPLSFLANATLLGLAPLSTVCTNP